MIIVIIGMVLIVWDFGNCVSLYWEFWRWFYSIFVMVEWGVSVVELCFEIIFIYGDELFIYYCDNWCVYN